MAELIGGYKRTKLCGEFRQTDIGKEVVCMGFVAKYRNLGNLIFIDVRDRAGIVQVSFDDSTPSDIFEKATKLRNEFVVCIKGVVRSRGSNINKNLPTGDIEIIANDLKILNEAEVTPFVISDDAAKEAEQVFLGENQSLDCINCDVVLPKSLQDGQIHARWEFDQKDVINTEGELQEDLAQEGALVMVSLTMRYDDKAKGHTFGCYVYPKKPKPAEQLLKDLKEYFDQEQEESKHEEYLRLPVQLNGRQLKWSQKAENTYHIILMLGLAAAALVYIQEAMKEQRKEQARKEQLLRQYPDMVSKISLLLGAGMTLSSAWERIVLNYQHRIKQQHAGTEEVYEQMLVAYREMQDGVGELKVYERFGDRCGTPQYRKFSMLVVQNLRKGSSGLRQSLEKEVTDAFALRKNLAKKAGEEAGTKILFPMMLMLCIVMVIILVPAFLTFQL